MYRFLLLLGLIVWAIPSNAQSKEDKAINGVKEVLEIQRNAWNKGDIETFMAYYWNSPELKFVSSQGVNQGWEATMQRYKNTYPDKAAMGELNFEIITTDMIAKNTVSMTGKYILIRDNRNLVGYFLLLWQKKNGKWVIISDATN